MMSGWRQDLNCGNNGGMGGGHSHQCAILALLTTHIILRVVILQVMHVMHKPVFHVLLLLLGLLVILSPLDLLGCQQFLEHQEVPVEEMQFMAKTFGKGQEMERAYLTALLCGPLKNHQGACYNL